MKRRYAKFIGWLFAIMATLFVCRVSINLRQYSEYSDEFNTDEGLVTFTQLVRYAAYIDEPPDLDSCINNLRQIDGAKQQWALETQARGDSVPNWNDIKPYLGRGAGNVVLRCKKGGYYTIGAVSNAPTCSVKGHALN